MQWQISNERKITRPKAANRQNAQNQPKRSSIPASVKKSMATGGSTAAGGYRVQTIHFNDIPTSDIPINDTPTSNLSTSNSTASGMATAPQDSAITSNDTAVTDIGSPPLPQTDWGKWGLVLALFVAVGSLVAFLVSLYISQGDIKTLQENTNQLLKTNAQLFEGSFGQLSNGERGG